MNITEVSKLTGIPVEMLRRMRSRESISLRSGPPYCKTMLPGGTTRYQYKKADVMRWLKTRNFQLTALDAASLLGISRGELLARYQQGIHSWESPEGQLILCVYRNMYLWRPKMTLLKKID